MRRYVWELAVLAVIVLGGAYAAHGRRDRLDAANDSLRTALTYSARQTDLIALLTERASAAEARADSEAAAADSLAWVASAAVQRYERTKRAAPDTCAALADDADDAIALAEARAEMADASRRAAQDAANQYRAGKDSALAALGRLRAAGEAVTVASRPSLLERVRPRVLVGVLAGVDPLSQRPAAVIGVGLGWSF